MQAFHIPAPPPYYTNTFLLISDAGHAVIIDPAADVQNYEQILQEHNAVLTTLLCTHGHFDHVGSAEALRRKYHAVLYCEADDLAGDKMYPLSEADHGYAEGQTVTVDELQFTAWHTPGHTPGSVVLLCGEYLFCGDTLFAGSIGRTDLVEHLVRLFYPMAPLTLTPPEAGEDCVWAEKKPDGLWAMVRQGGKCAERSAPLPAPAEAGGETPEFSLASLTYDLLRQWTGIRPPWGKMTGVRPVRLIHDKRAAGWSETDIDHFFLERFDCSEQKYQMAKAIADLQEPILKVGSAPKTYSLYIGIPFCPSRCSYCSFVSCNLDRDRKMVQPYVDCLCNEVEEIRRQADKAGLTLCSIYIGGGTPTSLSADQLRQLMGTVRQNFDLSKVVEYTVEAGRPDCTDAEKLAVIKEYGATRISINPQTFSDEVLAGIGRKHSAQDILDCYAEARKAGHDDINMDLIAGLPGDTVESFEHSLRQAIALDPENITVHTLTLKRASRIVIEDQRENDYADVAAMLEKCRLLAEAGYRPYYLYRQKNTLQNLENVGWCKPGHEGYYNIYIMEEVQTILSAGAGGSTKLVADGGKRMQRIFNFKYPNEYIQRFAEVLERKKGVADFYDHDLGPEASG